MAPVQHVTRFRRLSREELTQALDEVLSRASTTPTTCSPHRPLSAGPTRPRKAQTNKAASSTPPKVERKGELAPPQPTMRYTPPAQPYWAADGFRYLAEWLHKLSPSAFKVASYVAYQQLRGIVFVSQPVAASLCQIAAGTALGKTAVVAAVKEAVEVGVVRIEPHEKGTRANRYTINWGAKLPRSEV
jgi:hypothetical protein